MSRDDTSVERAPERGPRWQAAAAVTARLLVAALLLAAAGLKAHQLATEPVLEQNLLTYRWSLALAVECELLLGLVLLSGLFRRLTWAVAVVTFTFFCGVTLWKALSGEASCGCFGVVKVNPWITLCLDVTLLVLLLVFHPTLRRGQPVRGYRLRLAAVVVLFLAAGIPAGALMAAYRPARLAADGEILGADRCVVLEPRDWVGKDFPLARYVDVGKSLARGRWTVVLYHHDCPHCREALPKYEEEARRKGGQPDATRLALIELPPYQKTAAPEAPADAILRGKLSERRDWFVGTPAVVTLVDGLVLSASDYQNEVQALNLSNVPFEAATAAVGLDQQKWQTDFGYVEPGSVHRVTVALENRGSSTVRLRDVRSECQCMWARLSGGEAPAGGAVKLEVTLRAPKEPMHYAQRILVLSEASPPRTFFATIRARVGLPLAAEPGVVDAGAIVPGQEKRAELVLVNNGREPYKPLYATGGADCTVQVPQAVVPPGGRLAIPLVVRVGRDAPPGDRKTSVRLQTNCPRQPTIEVPVKYRVASGT